MPRAIGKLDDPATIRRLTVAYQARVSMSNLRRRFGVGDAEILKHVDAAGIPRHEAKHSQTASYYADPMI